MYRSHTCGELRITDVKKEVTLAGWVQTIRKFGSITFIDLRDRTGVIRLHQLQSSVLAGFQKSNQTFGAKVEKRSHICLIMVWSLPQKVHDKC